MIPIPETIRTIPIKSIGTNFTLSKNFGSAIASAGPIMYAKAPAKFMIVNAIPGFGQLGSAIACPKSMFAGAPMTTPIARIISSGTVGAYRSFISNISNFQKEIMTPITTPI